jgi:hypothetical protein
MGLFVGDLENGGQCFICSWSCEVPQVCCRRQLAGLLWKSQQGPKQPIQPRPGQSHSKHFVFILHKPQNVLVSYPFVAEKNKPKFLSVWVLMLLLIWMSRICRIMLSTQYLYFHSRNSGYGVNRGVEMRPRHMPKLLTFATTQWQKNQSLRWGCL